METCPFFYRLTHAERAHATREDLCALGLSHVVDVLTPGGWACINSNGLPIIVQSHGGVPADEAVREFSRANAIRFVQWHPWCPGVEVGVVPATPLPSPLDLVRRKSPPLPHHVVTLGDDPAILEHVPASWRQGFLAPVLVTAARDVLPDFRVMRWRHGAGWEACPSEDAKQVRVQSLIERLAADVRADLFGAMPPVGHVRMGLAEQRELAAFALGLFYRVSAAEATLLGLDHPAVVREVLSIAGDLPGLREAALAALSGEVDA